MNAPRSAPIELRGGGGRARVDPILGGSLLSFTCDGRDILRAASPEIRDPRQAACFPMVPFCNRLIGGGFTRGGRAITLPPNAPGIDEPAHGYGWLNAWRVEARDAASLRLSHEGGGAPWPWPWPYSATQTITLEEGALHISLSLTNLAAEAAPVGLGLHPYFASQGVKVVRCDGNDGLSPRSFAGDALDGLNLCLEDWGGRVVIDYADRRVVLRATGCRRLQVFKPVGGDFLCLEPVMNRAVIDNPSAAGMVELASSATTQIVMRIDVTAKVAKVRFDPEGESRRPIGR